MFNAPTHPTDRHSRNLWGVTCSCAHPKVTGSHLNNGYTSPLCPICSHQAAPTRCHPNLAPMLLQCRQLGLQLELHTVEMSLAVGMALPVVQRKPYSLQNQYHILTSDHDYIMHCHFTSGQKHQLSKIWPLQYWYDTTSCSAEAILT